MKTINDIIEIILGKNKIFNIIPYYQSENCVDMRVIVLEYITREGQI